MATTNSDLSMDLLKKGVEEYTGREVTALDRFLDPRVPGAFALRAAFRGRETPLYFLVSGNAKAIKTADDVVNELEEVELQQWPPVVGRPRFF